ncbi:MAG: AgmX/PglI C-terminal domain-containing protein, partial [Myxococcota bacterium]
ANAGYGMKFLCGSCRTKYQISDDKVRGKILTIRCKKCSAKILVRESLASSGGTAVAPVAEEEASRSTTAPAPQPTARPASSTTMPAVQAAASSPASSIHRPAASASASASARTGGSAALASAYDEAMGQGASESDDMPTSIAPVPANLEIAGVEWYTAIDGEQKGPFAFAELVKKVEDRLLIGRHYVWHDGMENWTRLREVPDLARYLPQPKRVPPPPPAPPEDDGRRAEVVELASRRAQLGQDLVTPEAPVTAATSDRAEELDQALNDVLGIEGEDKTTRASLPSDRSASRAEAALTSDRFASLAGAALPSDRLASRAGAGALTSSSGVQLSSDGAASLASTRRPAADLGPTQDVDDDMLASDDLFANIPRAASVDEVNRESTRFFVAAAGVNKQRKRRRIGMISGAIAAVALVSFLGGWAAGLFPLSLPGIGDPFANMRRNWSPEPVDSEEPTDLSKKELALLKGSEKKRANRRRGTTRREQSSVNFPSGDYVDDGERAGEGTRGLTEAQRIAIGPLETGGADGQAKLPEANLPVSAPDMPVPDQASLSQDAVARVVKQNSMSVQLCYQQSLKGSRNLRGKLQIKLRVQPSGRVSRTEVQTRQFKGTTLASCIADKIKRWTFPRFDGEAREFLVPFVLEKGN